MLVFSHGLISLFHNTIDHNAGVKFCFEAANAALVVKGEGIYRLSSTRTSVSEALLQFYFANKVQNLGVHNPTNKSSWCTDLLFGSSD
jgi:hypothetical protein